MRENGQGRSQKKGRERQRPKDRNICVLQPLSANCMADIANAKTVNHSISGNSRPSAGSGGGGMNRAWVGYGLDASCPRFVQLQ